MKRIRLDFAKATGSSWPVSRGALGAAVAGAVACAAALVDVQPLLEQRQALTERAKRLDARAQAIQQGAQPVVTLAPERIKAINAAVRRLNLPWRDLLDTLEQVTPKNVALLSLQPDADRSILQLTAEAASAEDMIDYVQRLKARPEIRSALLKKHQVDTKSAYHPVQFSLELNWNYPPLQSAPTASPASQPMPLAPTASSLGKKR